MLKKIMKDTANRLGYSIIKLENENRQAVHLSHYHAAILGLSAAREVLNVVVVGANDGRINDPIYDLIRTKLVDRVNVLLIEPQPSLIPKIRENYAFLPEARIVNSAVGEEGYLDLHVVREEYWGKLDPPYAREWPSYRAPTGVTSANREHVVSWVRQHLQDGDPEAAVAKVSVPCASLSRILVEARFPSQIDILQIDVEGHEEVVIKSSDLAETRPAVIYFESKHLLSEQEAQVRQLLSSSGYITHSTGADILAILGH